MRRNKYNAKKTTVDGIVFDSAREAKYYGELKIKERAGVVAGIFCHTPSTLTAHGREICRFKPDFIFTEKFSDGWRTRYVDVKSPATATRPDFRLKKKLFEAQYGVELEIVF